MHVLLTPGQVKEDLKSLADNYLVEIENEYLWFEILNNSASKILDAKYEKFYARDIFQAQMDITETQQGNLRLLLKKHKKFFSGKLGLYLDKKQY